MESIATGGSENLSQEELKARLFHKLKEDGTFNGFRALLRNELVKHLYLIDPEKVFHQPKVRNDEELLVRYPLESTNWLISEHLMRNNYDLTLSVFALESGMPSNRQNLCIGDILSFLHIDPSSKIGQNILGAYKAKDRLFLWTFLTVSSMQICLSKEDNGTQKVFQEEDNFNRVEERLRRIDDTYDLKKRSLRQEVLNTGNSLAQLEQVLKTPERLRSQKLHQFRDIDLESFRDNKLLEYQGEVDQLRRSLEEQHRYKLQSLIDHEKGVHENLEKQKSAIENDFFGQRQKMLLEVAKQKQREEEWENNKRFQEKMMQIEMERMESIKKAIQNRQECLQQQENAHEHWLTEEKQRIEATVRKKYDEKQRELEHRELELKDFQERLDAKEIFLKEKEHAHEKVVRETDVIKCDLANAKDKIKALQEENASLKIHASATTENIRLKAELHRLQFLNKEAVARNKSEQMHHNTMLQELMDKLAKPSPQAIFLQKELGRFQEQHQKESEAWYKQKAVLEGAVYKARSQLRTCSDRMKLQSRQIGILHQTIDDLQRGILQKTSLDSEIPEKHVTFKPSTSIAAGRHESVLKSWRDMPTVDLQGTYFDTSLNPSHLPPELELGVSGLLTESYDFEYDVGYTDFDSGLLFSGGSIDETRARIKHLEEEAEHLERTFKSFKLNSYNSGLLNRSVPQMFVPDKSTFSEADLMSGKYYTSRILKDYHGQESRNLEDFSRHVSSSTPNESSVVDHIARPNFAQQSILINQESQGNEPQLNDNSKTLKQDTALMTPKPLSRRLSFEFSEDLMNRSMNLREIAMPVPSTNLDFTGNDIADHLLVMRNASAGEIKLQDKLSPESNKILPTLDQAAASGKVQGAHNFQSSLNLKENIPKPSINLDSAWKSTMNDSDNNASVGSDEDNVKLKIDTQPKSLSSLGVFQQEFTEERVDATPAHDFVTHSATYGSRRHIGENDEADSEGHLSWEKASLKSNNGDDFEW